jgi:hypothetical protein
MRRLLICLMAILILPILSAYGQITQNYQWTALEQPYWANAMDVAYGHGGSDQLAWHRYLIGTDEGTAKLFWAKETNSFWHSVLAPDQGVKKLISYRKEDDENGDLAFCTSYEDQLYYTENGGAQWDPVPGSDNLGNNKFTTIEINPDEPGAELYVGCEHTAGEYSVFKGVSTDGGVHWDWNQPENGLSDLTVNDIELDPAGDLVCGTDDGIYKYLTLTGWGRVQFAGLNVVCLEALDYGPSFWAATYDDGVGKLYYTSDAWDNYDEVSFNGQQFNHQVTDIAAIPLSYGTSDYQSVYIGTKDGLFLINVPPSANNQEVDFSDCTEDFKTPLQSDFNILSLDYNQTARTATTRSILVGTPNSVYELTETRSEDNSEVTSVTCEDITEGTYPLENHQALKPHK